MSNAEIRAAGQLAAVALDTFSARDDTPLHNAQPILDAINRLKDGVSDIGLTVGQAHLSAMLITLLAKQMGCTPDETLAVIIESVTCEAPPVK